MKVIIYGAQGIALGAYRAYKEINPGFKLECFLVTNTKGNPQTLDGIPVIGINEYVLELSEKEKKETKVIIATPESYMANIEKSLVEVGLLNYERLDSEKWAELIKNALSISKEFSLLSDLSSGDEKSDISVYLTKFWKDKDLISECTLPNYYIPIQAGAENTSVRVASITDDSGDNISCKNPNYSELTVLYWIWKNVLLGASEKAYFGLAHYRRYLMIEEDNLSGFARGNVDVVLPYPMPYEPNMEEHHKRYLSEVEWSAVLQALKELQPDYYDKLDDILGQQYMFNYNIIVAKRMALEEYCNWLFPILFRVESIVDPNGVLTPNRYIGYIGETLETIYFMYNKDNLNIVVTGCKFLL